MHFKILLYKVFFFFIKKEKKNLIFHKKGKTKLAKITDYFG